jgi:hypothetical protein
VYPAAPARSGGFLHRLAAVRVVVGRRVAIRKKLRNEPNHIAGNPGESEVSTVRTNLADWWSKGVRSVHADGSRTCLRSPALEARRSGAGRASAHTVVGACCRYVGEKPWSHLMAHGDAEMRRVLRKSVGVSGKSVRVSHSASEAGGRPRHPMPAHPAHCRGVLAQIPRVPMDRPNRRLRSNGERCVAILKHRRDQPRPSHSPRCRKCRRNPKAAGILRIRAPSTCRCPARRTPAIRPRPMRGAAARSCQCWSKHQRNPRAAGIQANSRYGGAAAPPRARSAESILTLYENGNARTTKGTQEPQKSR